MRWAEVGCCPSERCEEHMDVFEAVSLIFVLLLALYGCAQAVTNLVRLLLRPKKPCLKLLLRLQEQSGIEQQIRFAKLVSKELVIPIEVIARDLDDDSRQIVQVLLREEATEKT